MKDEKPVISEDNMYMLLRESKIKEFNELRARGQNCDLSGRICALFICEVWM